MADMISRRHMSVWLLLIVILSARPCFSTSTLFANFLPTSNLNGFPASATRSNVAPIYDSPPLVNGSGNPESYILGDQFLLTGSSNTITSVTIYEVGNATTTSTGTAIDTP